jgi:hypothetical protein
MNDEKDYGDAFRDGFRRAMLHWLRASYEVVAGVGAFLDEFASVRREAPDGSDHPNQGDGPVKIDLS